MPGGGAGQGTEVGREVIKDGKGGGAPEESEARLVWPRRTVSSRDPLMPYPHVLICLCGGPLKAWDAPPPPFPRGEVDSGF